MPYALMINIEFLFRVQCDNGKFYTINLILTCRKLPHHLVRKYGKEFQFAFGLFVVILCLTNYNDNLVQNKNKRKSKYQNRN